MPTCCCQVDVCMYLDVFDNNIFSFNILICCRAVFSIMAQHPVAMKWVTLVCTLDTPAWCSKSARHVRAGRHALKRVKKRFRYIVNPCIAAATQSESGSDYTCCTSEVFVEYLRLLLEEQDEFLECRKKYELECKAKIALSKKKAADLSADVYTGT